MKNCYHEQRRYLLNNIELIKGVFENWSNIAIVPTVRRHFTLNLLYPSVNNDPNYTGNLTWPLF